MIHTLLTRVSIRTTFAQLLRNETQNFSFVAQKKSVLRKLRLTAQKSLRSMRKKYVKVRKKKLRENSATNLVISWKPYS